MHKSTITGIFINLTITAFLLIGCDSTSIGTPPPVTANAMYRSDRGFQVDFNPEQHKGLLNIRVNGEKITKGCGFGYIGGTGDGEDSDQFVITSCESTEPVLRAFSSGGSSATDITVPAELHFVEDPANPNRINFGAIVGPIPAGVTSIQLPFDLEPDLFTNFRHSGQGMSFGDGSSNSTQTSGAHDDLPFLYTHPSGQLIYGGSANGQPTWGEVFGDKYRLRVTIDGTTTPLALFFVNHFAVHNVEWSMYDLNEGDVAHVAGHIEISSVTDEPTQISDNNMDPLHFEAEDSHFTQSGHYDSRGIFATVNDPQNQFMAYGPYTGDIAGGLRTAEYLLALDNVTADNLEIAVVDVYDAKHDKVLARRTLRRGDFSAPFQNTSFRLSFTSKEDSLLEFRVFYLGYSYIHFDKVIVY